jgi:hypothetical protein
VTLEALTSRRPRGLLALLEEHARAPRARRRGAARALAPGRHQMVFVKVMPGGAAQAPPRPLAVRGPSRRHSVTGRARRSPMGPPRIPGDSPLEGRGSPGGRAPPRLARIRGALGARGAAKAGIPVHGLRRSLLPQGVPPREPHPDFNDLVYRGRSTRPRRPGRAPTTSPRSPAACAPRPARSSCVLEPRRGSGHHQGRRADAAEHADGAP